MFIEFRRGFPKTRAATRSDLRIALAAVCALALLIVLLPEADNAPARSGTASAAVTTDSPDAKTRP